MTNTRRFRRACSLRSPGAPALLALPSGIGYGPLEGGEPTWGPGEDPGRRSPQEEEEEEEEGSRRPKRGSQAPGQRPRRAVSLRVGKGGRRTEGGAEESTGPSATQGDAVAHSVVAPGGDDGQLLLGEAGDGGRSRVRKCRKQVHRALRRGWETFVSNVYSLTLTPPARPSPPPPAAPAGAPLSPQ